MTTARAPGVVLDCYGTLLTPPDIHSAVERLLRERLEDQVAAGAATQAFESLRRTLTPQLKRPFRSHRERFAIIGEALAAQRGLGMSFGESLATAVEIEFANCRPVARAADTLRSLRRNARMGLLTNADNAPLTVALARLPDVFDVILTSETAREYKPSISMLRRVVGLLGCDASRSFVIGDRVSDDIEPASEIGMRSVLVASRQSEPSVGDLQGVSVVRDIEDVVAVCVRTWKEER